MQDVRRFKPSTVSRRFSVAAGFYRTCVIDSLLGRNVRIYRIPVKPSAYRFMLGDNSEVGIRW